MKTSIDTAVHFLPPGTPGEVCRAFNRAALATTIAARATAQGRQDLSPAEMNDLAKVVRDDTGRRPLSAATRAAVRSALRAPLTEQDDPSVLADAVFAGLPDSPVRVTGRDGRTYFLVGVPA